MPNNSVLLLGRILLAVLFIVSGYGKLVGGPANFAGALGHMGFPAPLFFAWATTALEFLGGLAILVGVATRPVAVALALFCLATAFVVHLPADQMTPFMKNLGLAGGFLLLASTGAGALSVDARLGQKTEKPSLA